VPGPGDWDNVTELLAALAETTSAHLAMFYESKKRKGAARLEPLRVPRPHRDGEETARPAASTEDMRAFFGASVRYTPKGHG
jgi:hypothetical protein